MSPSRFDDEGEEEKMKYTVYHVSLKPNFPNFASLCLVFMAEIAAVTTTKATRDESIGRRSEIESESQADFCQFNPAAKQEMKNRNLMIQVISFPPLSLFLSLFRATSLTD